MVWCERILCFGDSNTWGYNGVDGTRFDDETRWPMRLATALGPNVTVIEEGLPGRTTVLDDPYEDGRNGRSYLRPCLLSHTPLDLIVLMLGTNDTKSRFRVSAGDIARGCGILIDDMRAVLETPVPILLVAPAPLGDEPGMPDMFDAVSVATSRALAAQYAALAEDRQVDFFDAAKATGHLNHTDGIHLNAENHAALAKALTSAVGAILKRPGTR